MRWPDIFFKAKSVKRLETEIPPTPEPVPEEASGETPSGGLDSWRRLTVVNVALPPAPVHPASSDRDVVKEMDEADTLRELSRSGGVRLIKRDPSPSADVSKIDEKDPEKPVMLTPVESAPTNPSNKESSALPGSSPAPPSTEADVKKTSSLTARSSPAINLSGPRAPGAGNIYPSAMTIFRRRTKMTDVARIVLPPKREESATVSTPPPAIPAPGISSPNPAPSESSATVIPPTFPVSISTGTALQGAAEETTFRDEKPVVESTSMPENLILKTPPQEATPEKQQEPAMATENVPSTPVDSFRKIPSPEPTSSDGPAAEQRQPESTASSSLPAVPSEKREKREFILSNGERILGHILSETPDAIYIDHSTLGVLTIPRAQIALRPVEIILINGDRVVGDIIAETADSLFVKHASLGILTVPRNQRSTRVVEAILKDGDRILGEVLGETENFTVIRSATLGTVAVPHNKVAMLNRRAEQVQMKALPAPSPELENRPTT